MQFARSEVGFHETSILGNDPSSLCRRHPYLQYGLLLEPKGPSVHTETTEWTVLLIGLTTRILPTFSREGDARGILDQSSPGRIPKAESISRPLASLVELRAPGPLSKLDVELLNDFLLVLRGISVGEMLPQWHQYIADRN